MSIISGFLNRPISVSANLITHTQKFSLKPILLPKNQNGRTLIDIFITTVGYHGTTSGRIAGQLEEGKFDNLGKRIYFADEATATRYAIRAAKKDGADPIVLKIYSKNKPEANEITGGGWSGLGGLGAYQYFPPTD